MAEPYAETWVHAHEPQGEHFHTIGMGGSKAGHDPHPVDEPQHHTKHGARVHWDSKRGDHRKEEF